MGTSWGTKYALRATRNIHEASTCHPIMMTWTLGWHYIDDMQQQWGINFFGKYLDTDQSIRCVCFSTCSIDKFGCSQEQRG